MASYAAESQRLQLQSLNEDHLQDYFKIMSSPEAMLWSRMPPHTNSQQTLDLIRESQPTHDEQWKKIYAIILTPACEATGHAFDSRGAPQVADSRMIGVVGTPRRGELAYKIHPDFWGNGYMSEALTLYLDMFWKSEGNRDFMQLSAGADPENRASGRVLEKAGFQKGEFKPGMYERAGTESGKMSDLQFYVLTSPNL